MLTLAPGIPTLNLGPLFERLTRTPGKSRNDFLKDNPMASSFIVGGRKSHPSEDLVFE
jgi:hypothetical protein